MGELREGLIPWARGYVGSLYDAADLVSRYRRLGECSYSRLGLDLLRIEKQQVRHLA